MKKKFILLACACAGFLVAGCTGPLGGLGRPFNDGATVRMINPKLVISPAGGSLTADEMDIIGTNGYPIVTTTNVPPASTGVIVK